MNAWEQALTNVCRGPRVKEKRAEFKLAKQFHPKEHSKKPSSTWHKWSPLYLTEKLPAEVQRGHRGSDRKMPSGRGWPQGRPALAPFSRSWFSLESGRTERNHAVATSVSWGGRSREKQIQSNCGNLVHRRPPAKFPLLGANPWVRRSQAHNWLLLRPEMQQEEEKQPGDSRRKLNRGHAVPCVLAKL